MTLSGIFFTKTSKSPGKSGVDFGPESQNTFKNTPEDDLYTIVV